MNWQTTDIPRDDFLTVNMILPLSDALFGRNPVLVWLPSHVKNVVFFGTCAIKPKSETIPVIGGEVLWAKNIMKLGCLDQLQQVSGQNSGKLASPIDPPGMDTF